MKEIIQQLREREQEAREASEDNDGDSLYHEGRADAYGVALSLLSKIEIKEREGNE